MPRTRQPLPAELEPEQRRLYDAIVSGPRSGIADADGRLRGPFGPMLLSPAVGDPLQALGAALRYRSALPARAREIATLLVAHRCDSAYEWAAHVTHGRAAGLSDSEIASLRTAEPAVTDEVEIVVVRVTTSLLDGGDLPEPLVVDAERLLGPGTLFDLVTLVGYYRLLAGVLAVYRIPPG
ncbi:carboxymuconolactone decarboxylase family protein [Pseudonocardia sp. GCM10023141]|uniref:carboxymuconolactone decarboxylase family protein n=1 Tax=Pseudonocardia sp. GCM10023141 TaxID=3252653 RepID=UPI003614F193